VSLEKIEARDAAQKSMGERLCDAWQAVVGPDPFGYTIDWADFDEEQQAIWNMAAERFAETIRRDA
jgi:hypothetical protein